MKKIGYARLIDLLDLQVRPLTQTASTSSAINKRQDTADTILFPDGVVVTDTPLGQLEFALRHEGVNLEVIDAAFEKMAPSLLIARIRANPNSESIRRACFLWEWMHGTTLDADCITTGRYVDLFPPEIYAVAANPIKAPAFRVNNNALGNPDFCPVVKRSTIVHADAVLDLLRQLPALMSGDDSAALYARAVRFLYLSETRSSFSIEREIPDANREERFVALLSHAGEQERVTEDWLVMLQNAVIKDSYGKEPSYRTKQNWLEDSAGRMTFLPPPPDDLGKLMRGWTTFVNDKRSGIDLSIKTACAAFGFVYLHPFMDGNGRLHRFMIHHVLQRSGLLPDGLVLPVSASIAKDELAYLDVLSGFSKPVTRLWRYRRTDQAPLIDSSPGARPYRYFEADREVAFLQKMIQTTILTEIPNELRYLRGYDAAFSELDATFDLPRSDISKLIRMIHGNDGALSATKRKQFAHLPEAVIDQVERIVRAAFPEDTQPVDHDKPS
ncbi:MAG: Fic family protein [Oxalobacteraceae bacterium]|nr:Fic family protein [Oxalobacteraceae bacterium]